MTLIEKNPEPTNDQFGLEPSRRNIYEILDSGFVVIDKDSGPTSHQVADNVKKILDCEKVGHSGTLDPKVTGVLIMGLGKGTRLMEYMLKSPKAYVCLLYLHKPVSDSDLEKVFKQFVGKIKQLPPIVSAVKREERIREIYSLDILERKDDNQHVLFKVLCERGTYIRKLCTDIAEKLGVGGQMIELRRTKAGPFTEDDNSIGVDKLRNLWKLFYDETDEKKREKYELELKKYIRPMEGLLVEFKRVYIQDSAVDSVSHGFDLAIPGVAKFDDGIKKGEEVGVFTLKGELVAMGQTLMDGKTVQKEKKGMFVNVDKVFMDVGIYPERKHNTPNKPKNTKL